MVDLPDAPDSVRVELRCPIPVRRARCSCGERSCPLKNPRCPLGGTRTEECNPGKLFTVLHLAGDKPTFVHPENLIEMYCLDCKRQLAARGRTVKRVLHRYDFAGTLVTTFIEELS